MVNTLPSPSQNRIRHRRQSGRLLLTPGKSNFEITQNKSPNLPSTNQKRNLTNNFKFSRKRNFLSIKSLKGKRKINKPAEIMKEIRTITGGNAKCPNRQGKKIPDKKALASENSLRSKTNLKSISQNKRKRTKTLKVLFKNPTVNKSYKDSDLCESDLNNSDSNCEKGELSNNENLTSTFREKVVDKMGTPSEDGFENETNSASKDLKQVDYKTKTSVNIESDLRKMEPEGIHSSDSSTKTATTTVLNQDKTSFDTSAGYNATTPDNYSDSNVESSSENNKENCLNQNDTNINEKPLLSTQDLKKNLPSVKNNDNKDADLKFESPVDSSAVDDKVGDNQNSYHTEMKMETVAKTLDNEGMTKTNLSSDESEEILALSDDQNVSPSCSISIHKKINTNDILLNSSNINKNGSSEFSDAVSVNQPDSSLAVNGNGLNSSIQQNSSNEIDNDMQLNCSNEIIGSVQSCPESGTNQKSLMEISNENSSKSDEVNCDVLPESHMKFTHQNSFETASDIQLSTSGDVNSTVELDDSIDNDTKVSSFNEVGNNAQVDVEPDSSCKTNCDLEKASDLLDGDTQLNCSENIPSKENTSNKIKDSIQLNSSNEIDFGIDLDLSDKAYCETQSDSASKNACDIEEDASNKITDDIQIKSSPNLSKNNTTEDLNNQTGPEEISSSINKTPQTRKRKKKSINLTSKKKTCPKVKISVSKCSNTSEGSSSRKWYISERKCSTDSNSNVTSDRLESQNSAETQFSSPPNSIKENDNSNSIQNELSNSEEAGSCEKSSTISEKLPVPPIVIKEEPIDMDDTMDSSCSDPFSTVDIKREENATLTAKSASVKKSRRQKKSPRPFSPDLIKQPCSTTTAKIEEPENKEKAKQKSKTSSSTPVTPRGKNYSLEAVALPFTMGWMRELVHRANQEEKTGKKMSDVYYFAPEGKKLRSMPDIMSYLSQHGLTNLSADNFTFSKDLIYREPFEIERDAKTKSTFTPAAKKKSSVVQVSETPKKSATKVSSAKLEKTSESVGEKSSKKRGKQKTPSLAKASVGDTEKLTPDQIKNEPSDKPKSGKKNIKKACDNSPERKCLFSKDKRSSTTLDKSIEFDVLPPVKKRKLATKITDDDDSPDSNCKPLLLSTKKPLKVKFPFHNDEDSVSPSTSCTASSSAPPSATSNASCVSSSKAQCSTSKISCVSVLLNTPSSSPTHSGDGDDSYDGPFCNSRRCGLTDYEVFLQCPSCLLLYHQRCIPSISNEFLFICKACRRAKAACYAELRVATSSSSGPFLYDDKEYPDHNEDLKVIDPKVSFKEGTGQLNCMDQSPIHIAVAGQSNHSPNVSSSVNQPPIIVSSSSVLLSHLTRPAITVCSNAAVFPNRGGSGIVNSFVRNSPPDLAPKPRVLKPLIPVGTRLPLNSNIFPNKIFIQRIPSSQGFVYQTPAGNQLRPVRFSTNPVMFNTAGVQLPFLRSDSFRMPLQSAAPADSYKMPLQSTPPCIISDSYSLPSTTTATSHIINNIYRTTTSQIVSNPFKTVINTPVMSVRKDYSKKIGTATRMPSVTLSQSEPPAKVTDLSAPSTGTSSFVKGYECLKIIFKTLNVYGLMKASLVCHGWKELAEKKELWEQVSFQGLKITDWNKCCQVLQKQGTRTLDLCDIILDDTNDPWRNFKTVVMKLPGIRELVIDKVPPSLMYLISTYMCHLRKLECFLSSVLTEPEIWTEPCEFELFRLKSLSKLRTLQIGSLGGIMLKDMSKYQMPYLPYLRYLSLTGFRFHTVKNLEVLSKNQNLVSLELGDICDIEPEIYGILKQLTKLEKLRLENGGNVNDPGFPEALSKMEKLTHLELMNYKIPHTLADTLKELMELIHLNVWPDNTTEGPLVNHNLFQAVSSCKRLKYVCWGIIAEENAIRQVLEMKNSEQTESEQLSFKELFDKLVDLSSELRVEVKCVPRSTWKEFCNSRK